MNILMRYIYELNIKGARENMIFEHNPTFVFKKIIKYNVCIRSTV